MADVPTITKAEAVKALLSGITDKKTISPELQAMILFIKTKFASDYFGASNYSQRNQASYDLGDNIDGCMLMIAIESVITSGGRRNNQAARRAKLQNEVRDAGGTSDTGTLMEKILMLSALPDGTDVESE